MRHKIFFLSLATIIILSAWHWHAPGSFTSGKDSESSGPTLMSTQGNPEIIQPVFLRYGPAPEFKNVSSWLGDPVQINKNKGKAIILVFWNATCSDCAAALDLAKSWQTTYPDSVQVVGVHTPEFQFETDLDIVKQKTTDLGLNFPVLVDSNLSVWNSYKNKTYPGVMLIDATGILVYKATNPLNEALLAAAVKRVATAPEGLNLPLVEVVEPEKITTLITGAAEKKALANKFSTLANEQVFTFPKTLNPNQYALEGIWKVEEKSITLTQGAGRLRITFTGEELRIQARSIKPTPLQIKIDTDQPHALEVNGDQFYTIAKALPAGRHTVEVIISQPGIYISALQITQ